MQPDSSVHVTEWGNGPRVVCVHGGTPGGGSVAFGNQKELEARWHFVVPDRPGHGQSPRQGREDFERDAELLAPLLADRAHLVGASYGAVVALYMAVAIPSKCSRRVASPGFEGVASAIAEQTGAAHVVVPNTDHTMQSAGEAVNRLLEQLWSAAETDSP